MLRWVFEGGFSRPGGGVLMIVDDCFDDGDEMRCDASFLLCSWSRRRGFCGRRSNFLVFLDIKGDVFKTAIISCGAYILYRYVPYL